MNLCALSSQTCALSTAACAALRPAFLSVLALFPHSGFLSCSVLAVHQLFKGQLIRCCLPSFAAAELTFVFAEVHRSYSALLFQLVKIHLFPEILCQTFQNTHTWTFSPKQNQIHPWPQKSVSDCDDSFKVRPVDPISTPISPPLPALCAGLFHPVPSPLPLLRLATCCLSFRSRYRDFFF